MKPVDPRPHWIYTACAWEATARKAGNVHPLAAFDNMNYQDFLRSAEIMREYYQNHQQPQSKAGSVSLAILELAKQTQQQVGKNTNLGILLLLAPLLSVPDDQSLATGIVAVVDSLDQHDTRRIYEAIRVTQPAGLQRVPDQDVTDDPSLPVREVMKLAQEYDLIARQYANYFQDVLKFGLTSLTDWWQSTQHHCENTVIGLHLCWLSRFPDSLIGRKLGPQVAQSVSHKASQVLEAGWPDTKQGQQEFQQFDHWLRQDGNRRNPGTSADLVAATLFAGFREAVLDVADWKLPDSASLENFQ